MLTLMLKQLLLFRVLLATFGSVAVLVPLAMLFGGMGWPVALVLLALGLPLLAVLALLGFPFFVVFGLTAVMLTLLGAVLTVGLVALKIFIFVVLPVLLVVKLFRWIWRSLRGRNGASVHEAPAPEVPA
jgi:hypothetical protein